MRFLRRSSAIGSVNAGATGQKQGLISVVKKARNQVQHTLRPNEDRRVTCHTPELNGITVIAKQGLYSDEAEKVSQAFMLPVL